MSPKWMTTFPSRRTIAWRRTVRHSYTILCSLFYFIIIGRAFLSSKLFGSLGIIYVVLLAVHLNAGAGLVSSMTVSILLLLIRWTWVRHRNVASPWHSISHRRSVSLIRISVVHLLRILRSLFFYLYNLLLLLMTMMPFGTFAMNFWSLLVILCQIIEQYFLFNLSESLIEIIFAMASDVPIDFCFINISRF